MIRLVPNSCTSPVSTLKGWPASATSSPMRSTRGSRRISSAIASRTASPYVSSRSLVTAPPWLQRAQRFGLEPSEILQVLTKDPDDQVRVDPRVTGRGGRAQRGQAVLDIRGKRRSTSHRADSTGQPPRSRVDVLVHLARL